MAHANDVASISLVFLNTLLVNTAFKGNSLRNLPVFLEGFLVSYKKTCNTVCPRL